MSDLPHAVIENARLPLHQRPAIRRLVAVVVIAGACFVGWKLLKPWLRSDRSKEIEAKQDAARARIGDGLDGLFEHQLDHESTTIQLVVKFEVAAGLGSGYSEHDCSYGFDAAFTEALGAKVVDFSTFEIGAKNHPRLEIAAKLTPSGRGFQLPNASKVYPGIAMTADIKFLGKDLHVDVQPASDIEFKHVRFGIDLDGMSEADVAGGILQGTCKQAAYALLETLTTWKRPAPPPRADPIAECERGFRCRENAEALEPTDRAAAAKLYAKACDNDDEDACVRGADLEIELSKGIDEHSAAAHVMLDMACRRELVAACAAAGRVRLLPLQPGEPISQSQRSEALVLFLRACDLGDRDACAAVVPLIKGTPFADAAPLMTGARSVASRSLGTIFALRWGQWTKFDRGQPTLWVTKPPAKLPEHAIVTPFAVDKLPKGITALGDTNMVYAVAFDGGRGQIDDRCLHCMPSGGGKNIYSMRSLDCVCALAPKPR